MMRLLAATLCSFALGCQHHAPAAPPARAPVEAHAPSQPAPGASSSALHLELGRVYLRFGDAKSAAAQLTEAARLAQGAGERGRAYAALGAAAEAAGDRAAAIAALEQALDAPAMDSGDAFSRLGRLYLDERRFADAESLYERRLAQLQAPNDSWQREEILRLEFELFRRAGTLAARTAAMERALDEGTSDEAALRLLALAYGGDQIAQVPAARVARAVAVLERLHALYPDDPRLARTLQSLYERAGRVDEALALAAATQALGRAPSPAPSIDCAPDYTPPRGSSALDAAAEAVRIRWRAGHTDDALAETARLAALAREGVAAPLTAAQLYVEEGKPDLAARAIERAVERARTPQEKRTASLARERSLRAGGRADELRALHAAWQRSPDECLRQIAAARARDDRAMTAHVTAAAPPAGR